MPEKAKPLHLSYAQNVAVLYELRERYPDKTFYTVGLPTCVNMKKVTLEKILDVLKTGKNEIFLDNDLKDKALASLDKMLELAK